MNSLCFVFCDSVLLRCSGVFESYSKVTLKRASSGAAENFPGERIKQNLISQSHFSNLVQLKKEMDFLKGFQSSLLDT